MRTKFKRLTAIICVFIVCLIIFFKFIYINSPERAVLTYNRKYNYRNNVILKKLTVNKYSKLFISMNNSRVYVDIINNNYLNYWKVTTRLSINNVYNLKANRCTWSTLIYSPKVGYKGIYLGVIDDIHVKKVTINNEECMIEKLKPNLYLWYKFSNKNGFNLRIIK